jgi:homoserine dehydrogenase
LQDRAEQTVSDLKPLRLGIAGLGTVGGGLLELVAGTGPLARVASVAGIAARSRGRARAVDISGLAWFDDPVALAASPDVDVFVELMGGADGPARAAVEAALRAGKAVVTANKALLAEHGAALQALATAHGAQLRWEAAVAGGIPVVKALREGLSANAITAVCGVLNGTCNYILTEMDRTGRPFGEVLADAQRLGYAEADPTLDVSGADAGHKLALLAAVAFSGAPDFGAVCLEGIGAITPTDLESARFLGYRIKLLAKAARGGGGALMQSVRPTLIHQDHPIARIDGPLNAVVIDAEPVGRLTLTGRGAGAGPTASAVAADILDLAHGDTRPVFAGPGAYAASAAGRESPGGSGSSVAAGAGAAGDSGPLSKFYVRLRVADRPGVIARITELLARRQLSIESFLQRPPEAGADSVPIILTTQPCHETDLRAAIAEFAGVDAVIGQPLVMPLEV